MELQILAHFFLWCTILNGGLLVLSALLLIRASDFVYKLHTKWFPMPRERFNAIVYSSIAFYKILIFVFNLVPWVALEVIK